jgi:hypothetical protein
MSDLVLSVADQTLIDDIFVAFNNPIGFPFAAVALAKANWHIVGTALIDELGCAVADPCGYADGETIHEFAYRLASDMRDTRAFAPLLEMLYLPDDAVEALIGDGLSDAIGRALACTFDTNDAESEPRLRAVAENQRLYVWSRLAAVSAVCIRAHEGDSDRAEVAKWIHSVCVREFEALCGSEDPQRMVDTTALELLVHELTKFATQAYLPDIEHWWATLDIGHPGDEIDYIRREICKPYDRASLSEKFDRYRDDLTEEFATWASFVEERPRGKRVAGVGGELYGESPQVPIIRAGPKVGRNDPCPCGSGLKYKKCCGKDA